MVLDMTTSASDPKEICCSINLDNAVSLVVWVPSPMPKRSEHFSKIVGSSSPSSRSIDGLLISRAKQSMRPLQPRSYASRDLYPHVHELKFDEL
ncbi:NADPH-cytochrome P450 reductase [Aspergillus luchuensis]|uniref:NADPH-cytochrome P450 reductase n=1 Tax=Aspergillus kawachii TaxID=1069201 RepID=A0A146F7I9_ASPKA|nr:NADPH-cytochrome P450 reductase [Aspergillus luchuensis]